VAFRCSNLDTNETIRGDGRYPRVVKSIARHQKLSCSGFVRNAISLIWRAFSGPLRAAPEAPVVPKHT
jgi:hypothetical protein